MRTIAYPKYVVLDGDEEHFLLPEGHVLLDALEEQLAVVERDDVEEVREQRRRHRRVHHASPRRLDAEADRFLAGPDLGVRLGQLAQHVRLEGVLHGQPLHLIVAGMKFARWSALPVPMAIHNSDNSSSMATWHRRRSGHTRPIP